MNVKVTMEDVSISVATLMAALSVNVITVKGYTPMAEPVYVSLITNYLLEKM